MEERLLVEGSWERISQDSNAWLQNHIAAQFLAFIIPGVCTVLAAYFMPANADIRLASWYGFLGGVAGLIILVVAIYIWNLVTVPTKQRNEARALVKKLQKSLGDVGYVDALRWEALEDIRRLQRGQSKGLSIDEHEVGIFRDWFEAGSKWIQGNMFTETANRFHRVDTLATPTIDNAIQAYESGFDMLGELIKTIQSISHKEGS